MKTFNIVDYGAHFCDKLQTEAIQKAIDDCFLAGGGEVRVQILSSILPDEIEEMVASGRGARWGRNCRAD